MSDPVIDDQSAAMILRSGGIVANGAELHDLASELERIARATLTKRYAVRGSRGRQITKLGREVRKQLFGDLVGFWIDAPGVKSLPGATYLAGAWEMDQYSGPFIEFARAYCGALADHIDSELRQGRGIGWRSIAVDLRAIQLSGSKARDCLRLLRIGKFAGRQRFAKISHS